MFGKKKQEERSTDAVISSFEKQRQLDRQYEPYVTRHYRLLDQIAAARKAGDEKRAISLCSEDIAIIPTLLRYWQATGEGVPNVSTFKTLAIIYEKAGQYEEAINVCWKAIELGFPSDGTKGGMSGRIEKLKAKTSKELKP